jgi:hypothetical protein
MLGKVLRRALREEYESRRPVADPYDPLPPAPLPAAEPSHVDPAPERPLPGERDFVSELERLVRLRDAGALSDEEFRAAKARLLG